ncbi:MAG: citrate lyase holo-[acyl-carrier protein] synthase [Prevotella sp.]|nr:citrate lyase holo-[acyl-carrier protein] synthase [Bacteroides sp.]MCM1366809.1 citrate lyase holo-[acyl-carrier protein] synthase [Prevotella sp.]MCM1437575.1 citrate lyase holo-[acyl-carrier protein] synthase [Prevotella sp.]
MQRTEITLNSLLESRDRRQARQHQLLSSRPGETLVLLTIVMPGAVKKNNLSEVAARAAMTALREGFDNHICSLEIFDLDTGFEAFLMTDLSVDRAKSIACNIEDRHPLGRLFDIDVLGSDAVPVSRTTLGLPSRKCLICGDDARVCMRLQRHDYTQLLQKIHQMVDDYVRTNP